MADDLVARLRAAIDETERIARAAGGVAWVSGAKHTDPGYVEEADTGEIVVYDEGRPSVEQAEHIARQNPKATLDRCAADRKILDAWDANERELAANSAEFSRPAQPMEDEAERFRRLGNAKAQGWELQGRRWALKLALAALADGYGIEEGS